MIEQKMFMDLQEREDYINKLHVVVTFFQSLKRRLSMCFVNYSDCLIFTETQTL